MPTTEDEIIRRRLLIDGDGGTDDKRISNLIRTFVKWCDMSDPDEGDAVYQKLLATLLQCEHTMRKSVLVNEMNISQQAQYASLSNQTEAKLAEAKSKIYEAKQELQTAKEIRKNRQEYDSLAKIIQEQPDRAESHRKLKELQKELNEQKKMKESLDKKLELRKKQFYGLICAVHQLMDMIPEDESETSMDTDE